jgi:hypothetical protein
VNAAEPSARRARFSPRAVMARLSVRLRLWLLQLLLRVVKSTWFRVLVVRPLGYGIAVTLLTWFVWVVFRNPESLRTRLSDPRAAELVEQLIRSQNQKISRDASTDQNRAAGQAMTWGVAGAAVILLTTVIVIHDVSRAGLMAAASFALAIPILIVCGVVSVGYSDPKIEPPTVRQHLGLTATTHLAHFIVCFGFAAMLWGFDWRVSVVFVAACYWALHYLRIKAAASQPPPKSD